MKQLFDLLLLTGIVRKPKINHYWSIESLLRSTILMKQCQETVIKLSWNSIILSDNSMYSPDGPNRDKTV